MEEPSVTVALLQLFCRDEALVGDILEEHETRRSRAWLWRQVAMGVLLAVIRVAMARRRPVIARNVLLDR